MAAFIVRRLSLGLVTIVGTSILVFVLTSALPGDVVLEVLMGGQSAGNVPKDILDAARHQIGLDKPLVVQYFDWIRRLLTGEMGYSYTQKASIGQLIGGRITPTVHIALQAVVLSWIFGLPLGVVSALRRNSVFDYIARLISVLGYSAPYFWLAIMVVWVLSVQFSWFPPLEYVPLWRNPWTSTTQTLGASATIGLLLMAYIARLTRSTLLEVLREDYITTARAKGLREARVITRHALKLAVLPVLTLSAVQLGRTIGASVVAETIFHIDGLGTLTVNAVIRRDTVIVQNVVLLLSAIFVLINTLNDLVLGWLDPRVGRA